jgi:hypothetical protein
MRKIGILSALLVLALYGCGGIQASFVQSNPHYMKSNRASDQIEIYMLGEDPPNVKYRAIGEISTDWTWHGLKADRSEVLKVMRSKAAEIGADAIISVRFVPPGVYGSGLGSGIAVVYEQK